MLRNELLQKTALVSGVVPLPKVEPLRLFEGVLYGGEEWSVSCFNDDGTIGLVNSVIGGPDVHPYELVRLGREAKPMVRGV